jgi:hypothetical protein
MADRSFGASYQSRERKRPGALSIAIALAMFATGCYERVVSDNVFAPSENVYKPNLNTGKPNDPFQAVGDAVFGPVEVQKRRR